MKKNVPGIDDRSGFESAIEDLLGFLGKFVCLKFGFCVVGCGIEGIKIGLTVQFSAGKRI